MMEPLDGNAIAGELYEAFGLELTAATTVCASCGAMRPLAELRVYLRAPGTVVRCPSCDSVVLVLTHVHDVFCVDRSGLASLEAAS
jgi:Family of unknown function (DUF6510)